LRLLAGVVAGTPRSGVAARFLATTSADFGELSRSGLLSLLSHRYFWGTFFGDKAFKRASGCADEN